MLCVRKVGLDLVGVRFAKHKNLFDASDGQKLERVLNQRHVGERQQALQYEA